MAVAWMLSFSAIGSVSERLRLTPPVIHGVSAGCNIAPLMHSSGNKCRRVLGAAAASLIFGNVAAGFVAVYLCSVQREYVAVDSNVQQYACSSSMQHEYTVCSSSMYHAEVVVGSGRGRGYRAMADASAWWWSLLWSWCYNKSKTFEDQLFWKLPVQHQV